MFIRSFWLAAFSAALLAGCSASQVVTFYPVKGPLSAQTPLPVAKAAAEGITGNTGPLTMVLASGETCSGQWSSAAPQQMQVSTGNLFSTYGALAGYSMTAGNVPGVNRGEAFMSCDRGTKIEAEFFTGSGTANGYGVAKDSAGNVYKMLF
jgi:hypothetical protein